MNLMANIQDHSLQHKSCSLRKSKDGIQVLQLVFKPPEQVRHVGSQFVHIFVAVFINY